MERRLQLQKLLEDLLGSRKVYFQPPSNILLEYACIIFSRDNMDAKFADNNPYNLRTRYTVTSIDSDPDSLTPRKIARLPMCSFNRFYTADNLNHDVFTLFF